jgi:hypothetical protein
MADEINSGGTTQPMGDTAPPTGEAAPSTPDSSGSTSFPSALDGEQGTKPDTESLPSAEGDKVGEKEAGEDSKKDEDSKEDGEEQKGAPETYGDFDLSAGEDIGYAINDEQKEEFVAFGKENDLSDKQMQNILNLHIQREKQANEARDANNSKMIDDYKKDGLQKSLKTYGDKYATMVKRNAVTYDKIFSVPMQGEEGRTLKDHFNDIGVSQQPEFFEVLNIISSMISEDATIPGAGGGHDTRKDTLETFFK